MNQRDDVELTQRTPRWAPRVSQKQIRQLYETDARGVYDEELMDEVGYALLARCQSFIDAVRATQGKALCPCCGSMVLHQGRKEDLLRCTCGWELTWGEYFSTIQHKQLSGAEPVLEQFRTFVSTFPSASTPRDKMLAIDRLIHGFHWYAKTQAPTRPVAVNLIEGRLDAVVAFLDELTYSNRSTPGMGETYTQWSRNIDTNRDWYPSRRKTPCP